MISIKTKSYASKSYALKTICVGALSKIGEGAVSKIGEKIGEILILVLLKLIIG